MVVTWRHRLAAGGLLVAMLAVACNPLTGTYAAVGKNELAGCKLAIEQINAKGGILGQQAELLVEDSTSGDAGTAVQKARKMATEAA